MRSRLLAVLVPGVLAAALTACGSDSGAGGQVLRVGTLSDAQPAIVVEDGTFTGYDDEPLRDIAGRRGSRSSPPPRGWTSSSRRSADPGRRPP